MSRTTNHSKHTRQVHDKLPEAPKRWKKIRRDRWELIRSMPGVNVNDQFLATLMCDWLEWHDQAKAADDPRAAGTAAKLLLGFITKLGGTPKDRAELNRHLTDMAPKPTDEVPRFGISKPQPRAG